MTKTDKFFLAFFLLLIIFSLLNILINRARFDQVLTKKNIISEEKTNPIPVRPTETFSNRAVIKVSSQSLRRGGFYSGSAFKIDSNLWITARHVINECNAVYVIDQNLNQSYSLISEVFIHPKSDMAAFYFSNDSDYFDLPYYADKGYKSFLRTSAFSLGYPNGKPGNMHLRYLGKASLKNENYNLIEPVFVWSILAKKPNNLDSVGGISGGPLLNKKGKVIGVLVSEQLRRGTVSTADLQSTNWLSRAMNKEKTIGTLNKNFSETKLGDLTSELLGNSNIIKVMCRT